MAAEGMEGFKADNRWVLAGFLNHQQYHIYIHDIPFLFESFKGLDPSISWQHILNKQFVKERSIHRVLEKERRFFLVKTNMM